MSVEKIGNLQTIQNKQEHVRERICQSNVHSMRRIIYLTFLISRLFSSIFMSSSSEDTYENCLKIIILGRI